MRVMLVDDQPERLSLLERALKAEGHDVAARLDTAADLTAAVARHAPEMILIEVDAPSRDTLESLSAITREQPRPIVLFASQSDPDTLKRAMRAGVSAYVVDGLSEARVASVINVAIARFHEYQALKAELLDAQTKLADRKDVDKAKGILMQRRNLSEQQAYEQLRKMAMDRNLKIGDAARALLAAAELL